MLTAMFLRKTAASPTVVRGTCLNSPVSPRGRFLNKLDSVIECLNCTPQIFREHSRRAPHTWWYIDSIRSCSKAIDLFGNCIKVGHNLRDFGRCIAHFSQIELLLYWQMMTLVWFVRCSGRLVGLDILKGLSAPLGSRTRWVWYTFSMGGVVGRSIGLLYFFGLWRLFPGCFGGIRPPFSNHRPFLG